LRKSYRGAMEENISPMDRLRSGESIQFAETPSWYRGLKYSRLVVSANRRR